MAGKPKGIKNAKIRIADNGYRFPEQLPVGEILIDSLKNQWILGKAIARGGFGEIYEARPSVIKSNSALSFKNRKDYEYVIKVDHLNGPLFCEMNFYIRAAKQEFISKWMSDKGVKFLGIPAFIATGTHNKGESKNGRTSNSKEAITRYRFLVMPRFGSDLQKILDSNKLKLPLKTAYTIGIKILDTLEYIHSHGYIHADIKASNLLLSLKNNQNANNTSHDEIWLVDYGLVEKYLQGETLTHKPYEEDLRKANNGTIEFTSRDAHIGCFSRKGDCEILAYNLLSWLSGGRLPWMSNLQDKVLVKNLKNNYMDRLDDLLAYAFGNDTNKIIQTKRSKTTSNLSNKLNIPDGITEFFKLVIKMKYDDKPNYKLLKSILEKAIISSGEKYDGKFYLTEEINKRNSIKITPTKRKLASVKSDKSNKSLKSSESSSPNNYSDISVILDDEESDDEIMEIVKLTKKPRKSSAISKASSANSNPSKSPINGIIKNFATNGRSKTPTTVNNSKHHQNGKTIIEQNDNSKLINGNKLLNENGLNKIIDNNDLSVDDKIRRRNPSRKVKNTTSTILNSPNTRKQHALIENNKLNYNLIDEPVKNGRVKQNSTTIYNKSENQIEFNGKILINPTPTMLELINHINGKNK